MNGRKRRAEEEKEGEGARRWHEGEMKDGRRTEEEKEGEREKRKGEDRGVKEETRSDIGHPVL